MPFHIAPGGQDFSFLDDVRVGVGELASETDGNLQLLVDGEAFVFVTARGHSIGFSLDEVSSVIDQLTRMRDKLEGQTPVARKAGKNLN